MEKNILADSKASPALQEKQRELERKMRANSLEKHIQQRPKAEVLVKEGILNGKSCGLITLARLGHVVSTTGLEFTATAVVFIREDSLTIPALTMMCVADESAVQN